MEVIIPEKIFRQLYKDIISVREMDLICDEGFYQDPKRGKIWISRMLKAVAI